MSNYTVSVAMCTFNGERYLLDQLKSIANQTSLPQELIISDDGSSDNSINIINSFLKNAPFKVCLNINKIRLGATMNFQSAISSCSQDIIFLCDQDDVWHPNKLETIINEFNNSPSIGLVFTNAEVVDENLQSLGYNLWDFVGFGSSKQIKATKGDLFKILLTGDYVTGATMAFRSYLRKVILPIPGIFVHDAWIAILIAAIMDTAIIPYQLIKYRQHTNNQIGAVKIGLIERLRRSQSTNESTFLHQINKFNLVLDRLLEKGNAIKMDPTIQELKAKLDHMKNRAEIQRKPILRFILAPVELASLRYHRYSQGFLSFARDILLRSNKSDN